ncbi:MAG: hypothetical protein QOK67_03550 [Nitrososphaeraceae archaeon]|nr:hypothetical protein [Nitrososphaeraceae archaeon]
MRTLRLVNLHCNKTDHNNTKVDETIVTVDNGKFPGFEPISMSNRSDWNINANIQVNLGAIRKSMMKI